MRDNGCWCNSKFHLPGERQRHLKAYAKAIKAVSKDLSDAIEKYKASTRLTERLEAMEEVATIDLNYAELCALLESGTVEHGSPLYVKLKAARDAFLRDPKVYGKGFGLKVRSGNV